MIPPKDRLTRAQIDLKAVRYNFRVLKRLAGKSKVLAVVKADAYGHGAVAVSRALASEGVDWLGVSDAAEGIELREKGIRKPVLLFETSLPSYVKEIVDYKLTPTVCTLEMARALSRYARRKKKTVSVHVKVDTGMRRLGVWHIDAVSFIQKVRKLTNLRLEGLYTHFPLADSDPSFTRRQIVILEGLVQELKGSGIRVPLVHAANSAGLNAPHGVLTLARPGLAVYGLYPSPKFKSRIRLKPVLSVKSKVIFVKSVGRGEGVSYGHTFVARRPLKIATLAIGYHDGYVRRLSNTAHVLIRGRKCPVLGAVTMDQIMVDVLKVNVRPGDDAVILGTQGKASVTADELAKWAGTISYEVVCSLGNLLPRVYRK